MALLPRDVVPLAQAAAEFGLSPITLRVQIRNGRLKGTKIGRDWFISRKEMRTYMKDRAPQGRRARLGNRI